MAAKENVTQLDVILEAIRYIDDLQEKLIQKIEQGEVIVMNTGKPPRIEDIVAVLPCGVKDVELEENMDHNDDDDDGDTCKG